ncbi:methyl-accepting chemotaxis protein [Neptunicella marina]|uniref:Chemotaxis protein n=1 Tax=Neptunicella marina TaxID=2125989 RepID=A0A8J6LW94_9ALTE|nr:methyl-accepting chemotaxis protein [Neptunicella marina]MBC3765114.1 chemotaxis protein [Neptunicella marina]
MLKHIIIASVVLLITVLIGWLEISYWWQAIIVAMVGFATSFFLSKQAEDNDETITATVSQQSDTHAKAIGSGTSRIAIGGATVSHFVDKLSGVFKHQVDETAAVVDKLQTIEHDNDELLRAVDTATQCIEQTDQGTKQGANNLDALLKGHQEQDSNIKSTAILLSELEEKAKAIGGIVDTINQLADQTNMLALNAAIEAARAGDQGRGFAVVADEVRELAKKTTDATQGIEDVVKQIFSSSSASVEAMNKVAEKGHSIAQQIEGVVGIMHGCSEFTTDASASMNQVRNTAAAHTQTNKSITQNISRVHGTIKDIEKELFEASEKAIQLSRQSEDIFRHLQHFNFVDRNSHVRELAVSCAGKISQLFEQAIQSGKLSESQVFDCDYKRFGDTEPPKYSTQYDSFADQHFPAIQEPVLEQHSFIVYAGAVDKNGYFPTHNKKFSQPLKGDYDYDLVHNRTKRIFNDPTGKRCGANTESFLLQTYKRDTGEVMHDLTAPIYVNKRHWGNFRIGYHPE